MWVYVGETGVTVNEGDVVEIEGEVVEYYGLTEVEVTSAEAVTVTGSAAALTATTLDTPPADWENYESVLVTLNDVSITGELDTGDEPMTNWGIAVEDTFMDVALGEGTTFSSVTGILTYNWDTYKIAPRSAADLAE